MGEVYRARDTKLNRDVALKILPDAFASDPDRLARFTREAQTLAALNHPNIAAIYGLEEGPAEEGPAQAGPHGRHTRALVMELVEGEDLSQKIEGHRRTDSHLRASGASAGQAGIPLDEALPIAKQIADALEAAHEQGIIHRDLKPANIMVRADGTVKVLDFGLAKAMEPVGPVPPSASMSPTLSLHATMAGMILGTAAYMSPEQARGKAVDRRADIWAFGAVLYEMLTGRRAFAGEDLTDTIVSVVSREPDWNALPAATPAGLRRLLTRCLKKDAKARLQAIGDARVQIEELLSGAPEDTSAAARASAVNTVDAVRTGRWRERIAWVVAALGIVAAGIATTMYVRRAVPEPVQMRFEMTTPGAMNDPLSFALSPNGRRIAFVTTVSGVPRLWVRPLDQVTPQALAGTEGASYPFWSPDGQAIGFFAGGKLKRVDLSGGSPRVLADASSGRGGTWNQDDVIVFAPTTPGELKRVAATGGTPVAVTRQGGASQSHRWPQFLPDGHRFLFLAQLGSVETRGVYIGSLDGGGPIRVTGLDPASAPVFAAGALLQVRDGTLVSQRFDMRRGALVGEPVTIAQPVGWDGGLYRGAFTVSATGILAHRTAGAERRQLVWFDRAGVVKGRIGTPDESGLAGPEISPDGRRVAVARSIQGNQDVWLIDTARGVADRFTSDSNSDTLPLWSPDGLRVVFRSNRNGAYDLFEKLVNEAGDEKPLLATPENKAPVSWSRDGRYLLYAVQKNATGVDLLALPLTGDDRKPIPVAQSAFDESEGQFSPDGRWVAYQSNASGRTEIYVVPFPGPGRERLISTTGGSHPRWRPDGKGLFYITPDGALMATDISLQNDRQTLEARAPVSLFATRLASGANVLVAGPAAKAQYLVAPDGRFLMNVALDDTNASPPITVVLNWNSGGKP